MLGISRRWVSERLTGRGNRVVLAAVVVGLMPLVQALMLQRQSAKLQRQSAVLARKERTVDEAVRLMDQMMDLVERQMQADFEIHRLIKENADRHDQILAEKYLLPVERNDGVRQADAVIVEPPPE